MGNVMSSSDTWRIFNNKVCFSDSESIGKDNDDQVQLRSSHARHVSPVDLIDRPRLVPMELYENSEHIKSSSIEKKKKITDKIRVIVKDKDMIIEN